MLQISHLSFETPFILAPLAGYSDLPFRLLCKEYGAGYCVSEMISCHGLVYKQANTLKMMATTKGEHPVSFQIFGADPDIMAEGALIMESHKPDMIDINMGCPVRKVTRRGAGAALMTEPKLAKAIIDQVVAKVKVPVTVKIRSGKDSQSINCIEFAKMAEDAGAAAITVHARTWTQAFSGTIDPQMITAVKSAVSIPVIGNGDVMSVIEGRKLIAETGCDGVMIGRGALGNPWAFLDIGRPDTLAEILLGANRHLQLIEQYLPADRVLGYIKNHMSRYVKGLHGSSILRQKIFAAANIQEIKLLLQP